jgi:peptidoglycan/LPS O-acetylase OafA/YrhL
MPGQPGTGCRLGYRPSLDGLRALAVIAVFAFHVGTPLSRGGDLGVDIFFVLSGFLITTLLIGEHQRSGGVRCVNFYQRRALRLCPALAVVVAAVVVEAVLIAPAVARTDALRGAITSLLYVTNWTTAFGGWRGGVLAHTWSLAIEEQFYVIWPVCLLVLLGKRRRYQLAFGVTVAVGAASMIDRTFLWAAGASYPRLQAGLDVRADQLLIGCALAIAITAGWLTAKSPIANLAARVQWPVLGVILAALVLVRYSEVWLVTVGLTVFGGAVGTLILSMVLLPGSALTRRVPRHPLPPWGSAPNGKSTRGDSVFDRDVRVESVSRRRRQ